jgi:hypothetical protein
MEKLTIRPLTMDDYDAILVEWWKEWEWTPPTRAFLPVDGTGGVIVYDGDTPICAGFMYMTNSKVSWVDWIISSRKYTKKPMRQEAIMLLVSTLTEISKNLGNEYCYALIKNKSLIDTYKEIGYTKGDEYVGEMIKIL